MTYLLLTLGGLAAAFYAAWQRSLRVHAERALAETKKQVVQSQADAVAERARYELLVADLKRQLTALEDSFDAFATPDALRSRFAELFPRPAVGNTHPASGGLPAGEAAGAAAGGGK